MRFLVDECTGPAVARWLREQGYDVFSVFEEARGISDDEVIAKAVDENRILLTNDKDFGEKVFKDHKDHKGIILLRLQDERSCVKIEVLEKLLKTSEQKLSGNIVVVTEKLIRFAVEH